MDARGASYTNPFFNTVPPGRVLLCHGHLGLDDHCGVAGHDHVELSVADPGHAVVVLRHIKMVHTSSKFHEQVYMLLANWLLMIGRVVVTVVYNNASPLPLLSVFRRGGMVLTETDNQPGQCIRHLRHHGHLSHHVHGALIIWRLHFLIVLFFFHVFAALHGIFLLTALTKVPEGAWFTLLLAFILSTICIIWRFGKEQQ